ncbi:hypothetical protein INS49_004846 [Diaporthe citri]|uniref:uncharacterized protein n=1 Tax=Diaporthe citri TaxID=83186 RepID=UPI001C7E7B31|nr:uncharacterized protein INS49_004846 [Diaporthe citri]KAG6354241.1 hypothetical protein INS49_004846 [Diaporthe citri]
MAVGSQTKTREEIEVPHKQDDLPECTHVEQRHDEMGVTSNEDPEVAPRNFRSAREKARLNSYPDRNAITVARLDVMEDELNMTSTEYQTCVSILFVGYILGQAPSNMLVTRVRPSRFMAASMALWAIVSTLTAVARDFKGLLVTRFFLGIAEAPFYPGALYMLATFYTRQEIAKRISILFTANICGTAFAGLIAIGVFRMDNVAGITGWRWLFIIQDVITFVISVASAFILPNEPFQTHSLSEDEQRLSHSRIANDTFHLRANTI